MATLFEAWEREILQSFGHPAARGLQCCENATTHLFAVARIDQKPEGPVAQRLAAAINPARHHRDAAGHCLEQHEAETLALAWHDVGVRKPVVVGLLGLLHVAGEDDAALEPHIFHFSLEARPVAAVANDNAGAFGSSRTKL